MLIIFEGLVCCLVVLLSCVIGIANGPVNMVFFYDKQVQDRVVENGLISKEKIRQNYNRFKLFGILPYFVFVVASVYGLNKARGFLEPFLQMSAVLLIEGVFDRIFIDWWWVNHTRAWNIPDTEDLKPYIDKKTMTGKWIGTLIGFSLIAAIIAGIMKFIIK
ncbi:MAG: hypothetical protein J5365_02485 [Erysipelotrichaceae bacterium]|nr:hypothetical protein [Erysipelotrichaceae bacterium]